MNQLSISFLPSEYWWGGRVSDGYRQPFTAGTAFQCNLNDNGYNQASPCFLSNRGRILWSDESISLQVHESTIKCQGKSHIFLEQADAATLRGAFLHARHRFFPAPGACPEELLFTHPQYNTWIELNYNQNEDDILAYAQGWLERGYPPGVLMIDDSWQENYGLWDFHPGRFRHPKKMIQTLHELGFQVMLWICPCVSPDSPVFRELREANALVLGENGKPFLAEWWNGWSGVLDLTQEAGQYWFKSQLDFLQATYQVDGFKLDAGDFYFYPQDGHLHCEAFNRQGVPYPLNEYRASWKSADLPLAQRLRDRTHSWGSLGLGAVLPDGLLQGLLGYPFICPDMIGGGEIQSFQTSDFVVDMELVVRYAQLAALFPMMQFSAAPWRILDSEHANLCLEAARLHSQMGPQIWELAQACAHSGEPMLRSLEYQFPGQGYETITDQFLLGENIMVAPVLQSGQRTRQVAIPPGTWIDVENTSHSGPQIKELSAPLHRLLWFRKG